MSLLKEVNNNYLFTGIVFEYQLQKYTGLRNLMFAGSINVYVKLKIP